MRVAVLSPMINLDLSGPVHVGMVLLPEGVVVQSDPRILSESLSYAPDSHRDVLNVEENRFSSVISLIDPPPPKC